MGLREMARTRMWAEVLVWDRGCERGRPWGVTFEYPAEVEASDTEEAYRFVPIFFPAGETAEIVYKDCSGLLDVSADGTFRVTGAGTGVAVVRAYSPRYPAAQQLLRVRVTGGSGDYNGDFNMDFLTGSDD